MSALMTSERRAIIGDQHRNMTATDEARRKMSEAHRGKRPYVMTDEIRANIGRGSAARYTPEYKSEMRQRFEQRGELMTLSQKDEYKLYCELSNWVERMWDRATEPRRTMLEQLGVFNAYSNPSGLVRDHVFSRRSGFERGVFPELLRHPCNLQLLTVSENCSKRTKRYRDRDDQTLETLFDRIRSYEGEWREQEKCLLLIQAYETGDRYDKMNYIERYYEVRSG